MVCFLLWYIFYNRFVLLLIIIFQILWTILPESVKGNHFIFFSCCSYNLPVAVSFFLGMIYTIIIIITLIGDSIGQTIYKDTGNEKSMNDMQCDLNILQGR